MNLCTKIYLFNIYLLLLFVYFIIIIIIFSSSLGVPLNDKSRFRVLRKGRANLPYLVVIEAKKEDTFHAGKSNTKKKNSREKENSKKMNL